jgi:hypothetical protein
MTQRLLSTVGGDRVLMLWLDELVGSPRLALDRVRAFLGLSARGPEEVPRENAAAVARSGVILRLMRAMRPLKHALGIRGGLGLARLNERAATRTALSPAFASELDDAFRGERTILDALRHARDAAWAAAGAPP